LAKNEKTLADQIKKEQNNVVSVDEATREGGSEGVGKVIEIADKDNADAIKKAAADLKKDSDKRSKAQEKAAKAIDKTINKEFKFESAKASLKAFPPAKNALA